MIKSFRSPETARVFSRKRVKKFQSIERAALRKLSLVDAARKLQDLAVPPGDRLGALHGDREGQHSIRINDQSRVCFRWHDGDAYDVEITDYH